MRQEQHRRRKNEESQPREVGAFLTWLRSWKIDWVAVVAFFVVLIAAVIAFMPEEDGEQSQVIEVITGEATVLEAEARLSKEMTPIAIDESSPLYEYYQDDDRVNIMLLGVNDGMTDTIMIGSYDMENQTVDVISIPRDTFYYRGGGSGTAYAINKINSIYHSKGVVTLAEAVSEILYGMPIHYYCIVEYEDVEKVMEAIGGVEVNVPMHMKYDDTTRGHELHIDIPEGLQTIDSSNVMGFLRFRKTNPWYQRQGYTGYPGGDIQRIQTQQEFVKATLKKCLQAGNIVNVAKVVLENVESDLTYSMAVKIATKAVGNLDFNNINAHTLPGTDKMINELSFWVSNEDQTFDMLMNIFNPPVEVPETTSSEAISGGAISEETN